MRKIWYGFLLLLMTLGCSVRQQYLAYGDLYDAKVEVEEGELTVSGFVGHSSLGIKNITLAEEGTARWIKVSLGAAGKNAEGTLRYSVSLDSVEKVLFGSDRVVLWEK